ncbi:MAG: alpha-1,2-fucosyltransferase [Ferruginibacter sp.]|nr:alpha-1,2-fucosyltransferase [Ferruginibacter sp.]
MENNQKVIVRLSGGMGNQLHQYAYALSLAKKFGCKVYVDKSFFKLSSKLLKITKRNYELDKFSIYAAERSFFLSNYYLFNLFNKSSFLKYILDKYTKIHIINSRQFNNEIYQNKKIFYIDGVFGAVSDYAQINSEIKTLFIPHPQYKNLLPKINQLINKSNSVAVHIRRTDYLDRNSGHEVLSIAYYKEAMNFINEKAAEPTFYFFGDDEGWIRDNFISLNDQKKIFINFKDTPASLFDFFAIATCNHVIISNSTFAWWAAYLNEYKSKIIIAPGKWLRNQELNLNESYPNDWHVI